MLMATLVTTVAATLGLPAPANAASAAALRCWPEAGPVSYSGGSSIPGWGRFDCSKSVAWMDITVTMERDGVEVYSSSFHKTRTPGNVLIGLMIIFSSSCTPGTYRITTSGFAAGYPTSGVAGPPTAISCGPVFPV
jgi:hypothetical protein